MQPSQYQLTEQSDQLAYLLQYAKRLQSTRTGQPAPPADPAQSERAKRENQ